MKPDPEINQISQTAFLTLQCHAMDAGSAHPVLNDQSSVRTLALLKERLQDSDSGFYRKIVKDQINKKLITHIVLRAKQYDQYIREFINVHPDATVVNIGCGLDDRFARIDNGSISFFDLDLPGIMDIKKQLFPPKERYIHIAQSVFEYDWIDRIESEHVILVAEGVFMYCEEKDVRELFRQLQNKLNGPEIVLEVVNKKWLKGWRRKGMEIKMKKELKFGEDTLYRFGISDSDEIEQWHRGYRLLGDWSYFDSLEDSLLNRLFRNIDSIRKVQWTVRYLLEK